MKNGKKLWILAVVILIAASMPMKKEQIFGGYIMPEQCLNSIIEYNEANLFTNTPCHYATDAQAPCGETIGYWYFSGYPESCDAFCQQQRDCLYASGVDSCTDAQCNYAQCAGDQCTYIEYTYNNFMSFKNTFLSGDSLSTFTANANRWVSFI